ncbi:pyroglutamylated RF-amide peptide receptor-like isoform X1 [Oculina patagonica]
MDAFTLPLLVKIGSIKKYKTFTACPQSIMASSNDTTYNLWSTSGDEFIAAIIVLGLISIVGLIGNCLVVSIIVSSRRRGQRSAVQLFLLHLAISDLLVCILCIPLTIWVNFYYPEEDQKGAGGVCKLARFVQFLAPSSSICLLTVISIDRYYSLVRPLQAMKAWLRPKVLITTGWIYAGVIFLPTFYFADTENVQSANGAFWYCRTIPNNTAAGFSYLIFLFIFGFGIQLVTIIVLYSRVGKAVWSRERKISRQGTVSTANAASLDRTKKRVTQMLLTVVIFFLVCWAPFVIYTGFIERYVAPFPNPADTIRFITYALGLFNSVCNPFIYFFNSPSFRRDSLRKVCLEVANPGGQKEDRNSDSNTRSTIISRAGTVVQAVEKKSASNGIGNRAYDENETNDTRL